MSALQEGKRLVEEDRNAYYGDPHTMWTMVQQGWSVLFKDGVTPERCILAMIWLKMVRELRVPAKDNRDDMGGYLHILDMMVKNDK